MIKWDINNIRLHLTDTGVNPEFLQSKGFGGTVRISETEPSLNQRTELYVQAIYVPRYPLTLTQDTRALTCPQYNTWSHKWIDYSNVIDNFEEEIERQIQTELCVIHLGTFTHKQNMPTI